MTVNLRTAKAAMAFLVVRGLPKCQNIRLNWVARQLRGIRHTDSVAVDIHLPRLNAGISLEVK